MQTHVPGADAEAEGDERVVYATMPPVRRALPWRVRQQNLAYRLAERACKRTDSGAVRGSAPPSSVAAAHFSFNDQYAEYFFDVRELDHAFDDAAQTVQTRPPDVAETALARGIRRT